jgi:hypothetical protein
VRALAADTGRARRAWRPTVVIDLVLAALLLGVPSPAGASPLRRLARSVTSFATDGVRYAAWQHTPVSPIVILDTYTGTRRAVHAPGCVLDAEEPQHEESEPIAGGGRFLLSCLEEPRNDCFIAIYKTLLRCGEKLESETAEEKESRQTVSRLLNARTGTIESSLAEAELEVTIRPMGPERRNPRVRLEVEFANAAAAIYAAGWVQRKPPNSSLR